MDEKTDSAARRDGGRGEMESAFLEVLETAAKTGGDEPLVALCHALVAGVPDFRFVAFVRADEEVWHVPCAQPDCRVQVVPVDVERAFVRFLKAAAAAGEVAFLRAAQCLPFIPPDCRGAWRCHSCAALSVAGEGAGDAAVLAAFFDGDCPFPEEQRRALRRLARGVSSVSRLLCATRRLRAAGEAAQAQARRGEQALKAVRGLVRSALAELDERARAHAQATVTLADLRAQVAFGLSDLVAFAGGPLAGRLGQRAAFDDPDVSSWAQGGLDDARVKMIVGVRGANKTGVLRAVRAWLRTRGVEEARLVDVDFEDVRFRRLETMEDVLGFLGRLPPCDRPRFLFLDEIGRIGGHAELLRRLSEMRAWNVWAASSTACALGEEAAPGAWMSVCRVWPNQRAFRPRQVLERIWGQIFMRDIVSGVKHPDIRAKEALAEYFSDHLGEVRALREIAAELDVCGRRLSANTVRTYRKALAAAYLVEVSEVYDVFERRVAKNLGGRVFWTDLELRRWRYGAAPAHEAARTALNELYLTLRRTYDKVYTPHGVGADFLTLERDGTARTWTASIEEAQGRAFFRAGGGGVSMRNGRNPEGNRRL